MDAPGRDQRLSVRSSTFVTRLSKCDVVGQVSGGLPQDTSYLRDNYIGE